MTWLEALVLGIVQGLSEFLPISSSGHLELFKVMLGLEETSDLTFTIVVHGGTALSTVVVYFRTVRQLVTSPFSSWADSPNLQFLTHILISAIPVIIVGLFFKDQVDALFNGNLLLVGPCLLITAALLFFASRAKEGTGETTPSRALIVGLAQAVAVLPGISRSGATISTSLLLGMSRAAAARFSFLMVLIPIFGAMAKDSLELAMSTAPYTGVGLGALLLGFVTSFLVGLLACNAMIRVVKRGGLLPFAIYCLLAGAVTIYFGITQA
jgi:undecaprenyl-diphosphatase